MCRPFHFLAATATLLLIVAGGCHRADMSKPLICIVVPSQDNPFFKIEADAAAARALALGYRVRIDVSVPGNEIVVDRNPDAGRGHEDAYAAIDDAFSLAVRRLGEHSERARARRP